MRIPFFALAAVVSIVLLLVVGKAISSALTQAGIQASTLAPASQRGNP